MPAVIITQVSLHRSSPRVWLEGRKLDREGFRPGISYIIDQDASNDDSLVLSRKRSGDRTVSSRKLKSGVTSIIDINTKAIAQWFEVGEKLRVAVHKGKIVIRRHQITAQVKERLERLHRKIITGEPLAVHSLFHGGGVMDTALHDGLQRAGIQTQVQVAVELERKYLDASIANNPHLFTKDSVLIEGPIQDVQFDNGFPQSDICVAGIPCTGASISGRAKMRDTKKENRKYLPEEHDAAGTMFFYTLRWVQESQPILFILENVKQYRNTASMAVIRSVLGHLGYVLQERVLGGNEFGALENRERLCLVAVTQGLEDLFDLNDVVPLKAKPKTLSEALERIPLNDESWKTYDYLVEKEKRDLANGKAFRRRLFTGKEGHIGCITRQYSKVRSTDPFIQHPRNKALSRKITPKEHARVKDIPVRIIRGLSDTVAHEVLGQSVIWPAFQALGYALGLAMNAIARCVPVIEDQKVAA